MNCEETCRCNASNIVNGDQMCDPRTGDCVCNSYWTGQTCEEEVNECNNETICESVSNSGCHNKDHGYECACLRGFVKDEADNCIEGVYHEFVLLLTWNSCFRNCILTIPINPGQTLINHKYKRVCCQKKLRYVVDQYMFDCSYSYLFYAFILQRLIQQLQLLRVSRYVSLYVSTTKIVLRIHKLPLCL